MAYATVQDMIDRYGATEMTRLSVPADQPLDGGIDTGVVETALEDASAVADSYLRKRYATPADVPPREVVAHVCAMVRFRLSSGEQKVASEDVKRANADALDWFRDVAAGKVTLDLREIGAGEESFAMFQEGRLAPVWP